MYDDIEWKQVQSAFFSVPTDSRYIYHDETRRIEIRLEAQLAATPASSFIVGYITVTALLYAIVSREAAQIIIMHKICDTPDVITLSE
ncbi:hypothetical protein TNCV_3722271 [Trichonephila clavipes]|nr:hypothetical protein TNCV_3722271 [Trichonephila clavipes]